MTDYAMFTREYDDTDSQRWVAEPPKSAYRSPFQRDKARVIHSAGLRRLGSKTQVLSPGSDDFIRTRLTHSLEVAQIGRELARRFGSDPDVVDTACLSHDLGHPPFGHAGEAILDTLAADIGGFEGNAQTLRLLTRLEAKVATADGRSAGLNLTRATLDACTKYPWLRADAPASESTGAPVRKFGVYTDDLDVFRFIRSGHSTDVGVPGEDEAVTTPGDVGTPPERPRRCVEAQLMDLADDISYSVHDVEDAMFFGALDLGAYSHDGVIDALIDTVRSWYIPQARDEDILDAFDRLKTQPYWPQHAYQGTREAQAELKNLTSQLIGRFVMSAYEASRDIYGETPLGRYDGDVVVPEGTQLEIAVLKGLATMAVMVTEDRQRQRRHQHRVLTTLWEHFSTHPQDMDAMFRADYDEADTDAARARVVIDQLASMTDHSAWATYHRVIQNPTLL